MADTFIRIDTEGFEQLEAKVRESGRRMEDFRPVARDIYLAIQADVDSRFAESPGVRESATVLGGVTWEALSETYLRARPDRESGQQLRDTGELLNSFQVSGRGNLARASADELSFGSVLPKARAQQEKRPMIFAHPELLVTIANVIVESAISGLK